MFMFGVHRRGPSSKFVPPILGRNSDDEGGDGRLVVL